ncbi:hypothetical protein LC612_36525 [Nostoc sp. CHAB 5834]|nr:hypothetical protein [Nostoc sp. CHAB 5834]
MSQLTDKQIQQLLETGSSLPEPGSAQELQERRLYQQLFDELKQELPIQPTARFSIQVMSRIDLLERQSSDQFLYGWLALGLALCLFVGYYVVAPFDGGSVAVWAVFTSLVPFQGAFIFGLCSLIVFLWLDLKLVREASLSKLI